MHSTFCRLVLCLAIQMLSIPRSFCSSEGSLLFLPILTLPLVLTLVFIIPIQILIHDLNYSYSTLCILGLFSAPPISFPSSLPYSQHLYSHPTNCWSYSNFPFLCSTSSFFSGPFFFFFLHFLLILVFLSFPASLIRFPLFLSSPFTCVHNNLFLPFFHHDGYILFRWLILRKLQRCSLA